MRRLINSIGCVEQVTEKDLDIVSVCVIRGAKCKGCIYAENNADNRYKDCSYVKSKFKVERPADLEIYLY